MTNQRGLRASQRIGGKLEGSEEQPKDSDNQPGGSDGQPGDMMTNQKGLKAS